jgi:4-amino-4-deoxy-L-arabinose transferase-like glycosyltransferase
MSESPAPQSREGVEKIAQPNSGFSDTIKQRIVFDGTATPVKTALFLIICLAWLIPGLIGHDPWKPDEAITMGVVHSMLAEGTWSAWLMPSIAGTVPVDVPPLYYWVAALTTKLFSFVLPAHDAARLATGFFMIVTFVYLYKSATKLFDERAGRIAIALMIGSLGLLLRAHEMHPEVAGLAGMSIALYGLTRIRFEARKGATTTVFGALVIALSVGLVHALIVPLSAIVMMWILHDWQNKNFRRGILLTTALLLIGASIYPAVLAANGLLSTHIAINVVLGTPLFDANTRNTIQPLYFITLLPWYALPTLPIAIWLWRKDRRVIRERIELALPLAAFIVSLVVLSLMREARDAVALSLLLPLALAAAHALDRLPKGVASFVDWFGLVFFGVAALALWIYWSAAIIGVPEAAARAVERQAPGFDFVFHAIPFVIAAVLTCVWAYAVAMAHRNNRRAIVNWAAGITLIWVLLNLLGLPAVDHVRSYRTPVSTVTELVNAKKSCVIGVNLGDPQRAMFDYFASLRFTATKAPNAAQCKWMLVQGTKTGTPDFNDSWQLVWEGARPAERVEQFRLYRRESN